MVAFLLLFTRVAPAVFLGSILIAKVLQTSSSTTPFQRVTGARTSALLTSVGLFTQSAGDILYESAKDQALPFRLRWDDGDVWMTFTRGGGKSKMPDSYYQALMFMTLSQFLFSFGLLRLNHGHSWRAALFALSITLTPVLTTAPILLAVAHTDSKGKSTLSSDIVIMLIYALSLSATLYAAMTRYQYHLEDSPTNNRSSLPVTAPQQIPTSSTSHSTSSTSHSSPNRFRFLGSTFFFHLDGSLNLHAVAIVGAFCLCISDLILYCSMYLHHYIDVPVIAEDVLVPLSDFIAHLALYEVARSEIEPRLSPA
jgi:hypothetical protein